MLTPDPFPHAVLDGLWPQELIEGAHAEILRLRREAPNAWQHYSNAKEEKRAMTFGRAHERGALMCAAMADRLASPGWIGQLEELTGLRGLSYDDLGGGLHLIEPGGMLGVHVDFNRHDDGRYRRVNVLVYLNTAGEGAALELWRDEHSGPAVLVQPQANRTAIFLTSERSWHGHPHPLRGPAARCSLAAYYYTKEPPTGVAAPHSTIFLED